MAWIFHPLTTITHYSMPSVITLIMFIRPGHLKRLIPHYRCNIAPRLLLLSKHYSLCVRFWPYSMSGTLILGGNNGELTALIEGELEWKRCISLSTNLHHNLSSLHFYTRILQKPITTINWGQALPVNMTWIAQSLNRNEDCIIIHKDFSVVIRISTE